MKTEIHALAVVEKGAELGAGVQIGPFAFVGSKVRLGDGTQVDHHAVLTGHTSLGRENHIYPFAAVGTDPQDLTYRGEDTRLEIGDRNIIREYVTINRGTLKEDGVTLLGNENLIMACSHIAHDCVLGNRIVMANNVLLGGHVHIEDRVTLGGMVAVHHYTRIGRFAFIGGLTEIRMDVPPFMLVTGIPAKILKPNTVGLERGGFGADQISKIKEAHRVLFRKKDATVSAAVARLRNNGGVSEEVEYLIGFVEAQAKNAHGRQREPVRR